MPSVWDPIWKNDSYSKPELRQKKAERKVNHLLNKVNISKDDLVIDMGCGAGYISTELINRIGCKIISIDSSLEAINSAKARFTPGDIHYYQEDAQNTNIPSETADFVIAFGLIEHIKDGPGIIREIYRILKPNGKVAIITSNKDSFVYYHRLVKEKLSIWNYGYQINYTKEELITLVQETKFKVVSIDRMRGFGDLSLVNILDYPISFLLNYWGRYLFLISQKME